MSGVIVFSFWKKTDSFFVLIDNVSKGNLPSVECIIHFCVVLWFVVLWRENQCGGNYRKRSKPVECAKVERKGIIAERE